MLLYSFNLENVHFVKEFSFICLQFAAATRKCYIEKMCVDVLTENAFLAKEKSGKQARQGKI